MKNRIITGITPSGDLTIGNYIAAIKPMVELQNDSKNEVLIFSADLHAITTSQIDSKKLRENSINSIATYLASGIDYKKTIVFLQSEIKEHTELAYIFMCNLNYGELSRMTQFKDKSQNYKQSNGTEIIPFGLLAYPALMAADILLYNVNKVPVGKDQKQHIELTRNIAERLNKKYKLKMPLPQNITSNDGSSKIMSLSDPSKKMSKSDKDINGTIFLKDSEQIIRKKIKTAVTDSENKVYFDEIKKPGISNLMLIYSSFTEKKLSEIEKEFKNKNYGEFKNSVADSIVEKLNVIETKKNEIIKTKLIDEALEIGYKKAKKIASDNISLIKDKIGFYRR